jgi:hypothetical protein
MTTPPDSSAERSMINRLSAIGAGQEQTAKEVEQIRSQLKALLILNAYLLAVGLLCWLALRQRGAKP